MQNQAIAYACELIGHRSLTPDDAGCQDWLQGKLAPLGFRFEVIERSGVRNLWAVRGDHGPLLCFAGHTDVVPTGPLEHWHSDPFTPTERNGLLYGRGAADMKASIACFLAATEAFIARHTRTSGRLAFLITSDEEGPSIDGTARVVEALQARGERLDYCIVGEPTSVTQCGDMIKNGRRGSLHGKLAIHGKQGHIAYPHLARNPIHLAGPALVELAAETWDNGNEFFPPTTWQMSNIHAGTGAVNVIPGQLEVYFNFRFSTASTVAGLQQRVTAILDRHGLDYRLDWDVGAHPFLTGRGRLVAALSAAIEKETGITPELSTTGGTSDGRFIAQICDEVVEFGPINASIHQINEHVSLADIRAVTGIYFRTLETLLG